MSAPVRLLNRNSILTAVRVALMVGSVLFVINHGAAAMRQEMSRARWVAAGLTYLVPFGVNLHGQVAARKRGSKP